MPYEAFGILHLTIYTKRMATLDVREIRGPQRRPGAGALVALARPNRHIAPHGRNAFSGRCMGWATTSSCSMRARAWLDLTVPRRRAIADRRLGVGCDQLIVLEPPTERDADVFMRIYNPDGSEAQACGNATRCVASVRDG